MVKTEPDVCLNARTKRFSLLGHADGAVRETSRHYVCMGEGMVSIVEECYYNCMHVFMFVCMYVCLYVCMYESS